MRVSRAEIEKELTRIKEVLAQFEGGASISAIAERLTPHIEQHTLRRRLAKLEELGDVRTSGQRKWTTYQLIFPVRKEAVAAPTAPVSGKHQIVPLSQEAKDVVKIISQPEEKRKPVAYNIDFLMSYRPNEDSYLSDLEKNKLAALGKTTGSDQPAGTYAKNILQRFLIDLAWNSSRLEGNTYSLLETQRLLSLGKAADDKTAEEAQMILNHKEAIEFIVHAADEIHFNAYFVSGLHALLSNNLMTDPDASGRLRTIGVGIGLSVYMPPEIPQQIEEMYEIILHKADLIENPFEQSFFVSVHLPYLQPFEDVNKRVSRLAANIPLIKHNLSPLSFVGVPKDVYIYGLLGIYELNKIDVLKDVFMWAYERSAARYAALRQTIGRPDPFVSAYRQEIRNIVSDIVLKATPYKEAVQKIKQAADRLPQEDRIRFIEIVDTDLMNLKENNIARYFIHPYEFRTWKEKWEL